MARSIGIVSQNPLVAGAIYMEMIARFNSAEINHWQQPNVALYSPKLGAGFSADDARLEATEVMRIMGVESVVFPDDPALKTNGHQILTKSKLILPDIATLEGRDADIRGYVEKRLKHGWKQAESTSEASEIEAAIGAWAEFLIDVAYNPEKTQGVRRIERSSVIDSAIFRKLRDPKRHGKGLIGCQGGMSSEGGVEFFVSTAMNSDSSVLLMSVPTTPHFVPSIITMTEEGLDWMRIGLNNPIQELRDVMGKLKKAGCDVIVPVCNTLHYFFDAVRDWSVKTVNMPATGINKIPRLTDGNKTKVLLLATEASIKGKIFQETARRIGRLDIEWLVPTELQSKVNEAIWDHIVHGRYEKGGDLLMEVFDAYARIHGEGFLVMGGCTEIVMGIGGRVDSLRLIDNAVAARDEAMAIARGVATARNSSSAPAGAIIVSRDGVKRAAGGGIQPGSH